MAFARDTSVGDRPRLVWQQALGRVRATRTPSLKRTPRPLGKGAFDVRQALLDIFDLLFDVAPKVAWGAGGVSRLVRHQIPVNSHEHDTAECPRRGLAHYNDQTMHWGACAARFGRLAPLARGGSVEGVVVLTLGAILAGGPAVPAPRAQTPSASDLAARVQARYNTIHDFTADFTQRQTSPLLPRPVTERGDVKVKKPGRMRWTYATGDRNQVVSDGTMIYFYFPRDRYVSPSPMPKDDEASTALLFLAGQGNLTRDFAVSLPADQPSGEWQLQLLPRAKEADFESLTLEVDRATLAFRGLVTVDEQGGTSAFRFTNLRENRGLTEREFEFAIPRGVEVR